MDLKNISLCVVAASVLVSSAAGQSLGTSYCIAVPNSTGRTARITAVGSPSLSTDDVTLITTGATPYQFALYLTGTMQDQAPWFDGFRCIRDVHRIFPITSSDLTGTSSLGLDFPGLSSQGIVITPGSTWNFQVWYRDIGAGGTLRNLSDGVEISFVP